STAARRVQSSSSDQAGSCKSSTSTSGAPLSSYLKGGVGGNPWRASASYSCGYPLVATARSCSPSQSTNEPSWAPQRECAFSKIASNTGARSPSDELMNCKTSEVAVCRARDSSRWDVFLSSLLLRFVLVGS